MRPLGKSCKLAGILAVCGGALMSGRDLRRVDTALVLAGNWVVVLTGLYAGVASALAWGMCLGLGNGRGGAAWGGRLALRVSDFGVDPACGFNVAVGLVARRCCVARCCS